MGMEVESMQSISELMATQFYNATEGQVGTNTKQAFDALAVVGSLSKSHGPVVKKDFNQSLSDIFVSNSKQFTSTEEVIKSEMSGFNEKMALAAYERGDVNDVQLTKWDYIKGYTENLTDYIVNNPITSVIQAGAFGGLLATKMPLYAKIPLGILAALGVGYLSPRVSKMIEGKKDPKMDVQA